MLAARARLCLLECRSKHGVNTTKRTAASQGDRARAAKLTTEERSEIAKAAARAGWGRIKNPDVLPEAESDGLLKIGDVSLDVYRLKDGRRLISKKAMAAALGLKSEGGNAFMRTMSRQGVRSGLAEELVERIQNKVGGEDTKPLAL